MADEAGSRGVIRRLLPYTSVALLIAAVYVGWVFLSRYQSNRDVEQQSREKEAAQAKQTLDMLGGADLKILSYSINPPAVAPGGRAVICYGVNNAKTVQIVPTIEGVGPALSRCIEIHPTRTTEYELKAQDAAGHSVSQKLTIQVR